MKPDTIISALTRQDDAFESIERALQAHAELWDKARDTQEVLADFRGWFESLRAPGNRLSSALKTPGDPAARAEEFLDFVAEVRDDFDLIAAAAELPIADRALIAGWMVAPWRASGIKPFDRSLAVDGIAGGNLLVTETTYVSLRDRLIMLAPSLAPVRHAGDRDAALRAHVAGPRSPTKHLACFLLQLRGEPVRFVFGRAVEECPAADIAALSGWVFSPWFPVA